MATTPSAGRAAAPTGKTFTLQLHLALAGVPPGADAPALAAYLFTHQGLPLGGVALDQGQGQVVLPGTLDGQTARLVLGPPLPLDGPRPSLAALLRAGAWHQTLRLQRQQPVWKLKVPLALLPPWCVCALRGRVVTRFVLPDGTSSERPVCQARVHVCEVDRLPWLIDRLPELDLHRVRDELLEKLQDWVVVDTTPGPIPEPEPEPWRAGLLALQGSAGGAAALQRSAAALVAPRALAAPDLAASKAVSAARAVPVAAVAQSLQRAGASALALRQALKQVLVVDLRPVWCNLGWLWQRLRCDEVLTLDVDAGGRFSAWLFHRCDDQPDLYFWVEQFQNGQWVTVYRPSVACHTRWDHACSDEVVLHVPGAMPCQTPDYDLPDGVQLFVLPWSIGHVGIWNQPGGAAAPQGMLRADGLLDHVAPGLGGVLANSPFGGTLSFLQDDSWFIPSETPSIQYYRYSVRRAGATPNTGVDDASWAPLLTPLSRGYRLEYSDRLPTYQGFPVGPLTVGGRQGLFRFRPQNPPNPGGTVVASEWTSGNLSEAAAVWDTTGLAPGMSDGMAVDQAGVFEVKVEVFDANGNLVQPGAATFQFLGRNAAGTAARASTAGEVVAGAYVMRVHLDNNPSSASLPQPSIGGVGPSPDCGFLRYDDGDVVQLQFQARHPNDRAVFAFHVKRGSNTLALASTTSPWVEAAAALAPTTGTSYADVGGVYRHGFTPPQLVGPCVNAAFSATVAVWGKASNGWQRIGYDAHLNIAFALAQRGT